MPKWFAFLRRRSSRSRPYARALIGIGKSRPPRRLGVPENILRPPPSCFGNGRPGIERVSHFRIGADGPTPTGCAGTRVEFPASGNRSLKSENGLWGWRLVYQGAVWPEPVVLPPKAFFKDFRFGEWG